MSDGAIPSAIRDPASGVIALDINVTHLWTRHRELTATFKSHVDDDTVFRGEVWKRVGHLENLKWWILGAGAAVSVVIGLIWSFGNEIAQMRLSRIVEAQSRADREYLDVKFAAYEKAMKEREAINLRPVDDPPAEPVRRRR